MSAVESDVPLCSLTTTYDENVFSGDNETRQVRQFKLVTEFTFQGIEVYNNNVGEANKSVDAKNLMLSIKKQQARDVLAERANDERLKARITAIHAETNHFASPAVPKNIYSLPCQ